MIEADTVAHCGPTLVGEFVRTLTMTDLVIGWRRELLDPQQRHEVDLGGIDELQGWFRFEMKVFDSDCS